jgi:hypothetical protein
MATRSADKDLENGIKVALDAADTASGVTEEFNNVREQFEVVNIQAKRIYQSVLIIFVSAIVAAIISIGAGSFNVLQSFRDIANKLKYGH